MKVVLSGIFYPMAILRYFEAALLRHPDVELCTVGPYTATWIPWAGGMRLPQKYAKSPDVSFPVSNGSLPAVPIDFVGAKLPWKPDLWIQVDAGWHLKGKPAYGKNVIVGTDPHCLQYDAQRQLADTFYCMQKVYARPGDEYLPYAYDPIWHAPEEQPQNFDACLLGMAYGQRERLVAALRQRGIVVHYELGPCFEDARAIYNQAPIGLNWSSLDDLNARVFELLGMGRLAIVNRVTDLERFFYAHSSDLMDLITFTTLNEAVEATIFYTEHPEAAKKIAKRGHEAVKEHTWDARIRQILDDI